MIPITVVTAIAPMISILTFLSIDNGTPDRIRTYDPRLRRPLLYPAELRAHVVIIEQQDKKFKKKREQSLPLS